MLKDSLYQLLINCFHNMLAHSRGVELVSCSDLFAANMDQLNKDVHGCVLHYVMQIPRKACNAKLIRLG